MSVIVERLRRMAEVQREGVSHGGRNDNFKNGNLVTEAADEIERLRAENLDLAKHIDGCVRVAADALKRAEVAEAVCRLTRPVVGTSHE